MTGVAWVLATSTAWAGEALLAQYVTDVWNRDRGLPTDTVTSIAQTPEGYLWLATRAGLVRFDGVRSTLYDREALPGIRTNIIPGVFVDRQGGLWVAPLEPSVLRFDGKKWRHFGAAAGLGEREIAGFFHGPKGEVWLAPFRGGLLEWKGERFEPVRTPKPLPPSSILRVMVGQDGEIWLGTAEHGLIRWQGDQWDFYDKSTGLPSNGIWGVVAAPKGGMWIGTNQGVIRVEVTGRKLNVVEVVEALRGKAVDSVTRLRNGEVWWGTVQDGLIRQMGDDIDTMADPGLLPNLNIRAIFEDREGAVWVGTPGGLIRFVKPKLLFFEFSQNTEARYTGRLGLMNGNEPVLTRMPDQLVAGWGPKQRVLARIPGAQPGFEVIGTGHDGSVWVRSDPGLLFRYLKGRIEKVPVPGREVWQVYTEAPDGKVYLASREGDIFIRIGESWKPLESPVPLKGAVLTLMTVAADGTLWVGTRKGLAALRGSNWQVWKAGKGLPSNLVSALYCDSAGGTWVGTASGLVWFGSNSVRGLDKKTGLPDEAITSVSQDKAGDWWLASSNGVFRISREDMDSWKSGRKQSVRVELFGREDGLKRSDGQPFTGSHVGHDGRIWFQMLRGVVEVDRSRLERNTLVPETRIERVVVDGSRKPVGDLLRLESAASRLEFHFTSLSLLRPERNRFQYRLVGYDAQWVDAGTERRALYTGLPGGSYRFEVRGTNDAGIGSREVATLAVEKDKKFTETAGLPLLGMVGLGGLFGTGVWVRGRQLRRRYELQLIERQRIARELHDGLLQEFNGAAMQLAALQMRHANTALAGELEGVVGKLEASLRESRLAIQTLRGREWNGVRLSAALEQCLGSLCQEQSIHWQCECDEPQAELKSEVKEALWQIARESIRNSIRHGRARDLRVQLRLRNSELVLIIEDNGCGFDVDATRERRGSHFGLEGVRERAEQVGGRVRIDSRPGQGCRTEVTVPARNVF